MEEIKEKKPIHSIRLPSFPSNSINFYIDDGMKDALEKMNELQKHFGDQAALSIYMEQNDNEVNYFVKAEIRF